MIRNTLISPWQAVALLALFRVFSLLTFVPRIGGVQNGASVLLALPVSYLLLALVLLPALLLLRRHGGCNAVDCALQLNKPVGKLLAALLGLFSVLIAADTISNFEFLLTTAVYPQTPPLFFILTFAAVCAYAAFLGLEPVARVGTVVFVIFVGVLVFLSAAILPKADFLALKNPMAGGSNEFFSLVIANCFSNFDVVLWLFLAPHIKGSTAKSFVGWLAVTLPFIEYLVLLLTVGLGDYAASQTFPFYSLAAYAELSIFQRLDSLHITLWTFIAFVKVAVYLYFAAHCLGYLMPRRMKKTSILCCGALAAAGAAVLSSGPRRLGAVRAAVQSGIPVAVLAVLIPFALLIWSLAVRKKKGKLL